ncbi:hypothetical protein BD414DRAFT_283059 [Trametes punicea]|nr:hypothetical protein BD414DRAFT_283059 [Trametes punicea]
MPALASSPVLRRSTEIASSLPQQPAIQAANSLAAAFPIVLYRPLSKRSARTRCQRRMHSGTRHRWIESPLTMRSPIDSAYSAHALQSASHYYTYSKESASLVVHGDPPHDRLRRPARSPSTAILVQISLARSRLSAALNCPVHPPLAFALRTPDYSPEKVRGQLTPLAPHRVSSNGAAVYHSVSRHDPRGGRACMLDRGAELQTRGSPPSVPSRFTL